ncbi:hypothetical protein [Bradyrhizobium sp. RDM4]|uniref:hypothetical protein n=1 Tax=Bradyrhizobium sp. RDM4 TaxID=3378765 RepID=UPI0038FCD203
MEKVRRLREMGSLCRQQAAYNRTDKWNLLAEAEYWEHLAQLELSSYFQECNAVSSDEVALPEVFTDANDAQGNDTQCALTEAQTEAAFTSTDDRQLPADKCDTLVRHIKTCRPDPSPGDYGFSL